MWRKGPAPPEILRSLRHCRGSNRRPRPARCRPHPYRCEHGGMPSPSCQGWLHSLVCRSHSLGISLCADIPIGSEIFILVCSRIVLIGSWSRADVHERNRRRRGTGLGVGGNYDGRPAQRGSAEDQWSFEGQVSIIVRIICAAARRKDRSGEPRASLNTAIYS